MAQSISRSAAEFVRALRANDFAAADELLPDVDAGDDAVRRAVAELHTHRHRWADAAAALDGMAGAEVVLRRNLCRNLAALKAHRPDVYRVALVAVEGDAGEHRPHVRADGSFTVARVNSVGRAVPVVADPAAHLRQAAEQLKPLMENGTALAVLSIADGGVLAWLAANAPTLFLGRQQPVYLIEPDAGQLLACLLTSDFTGPLGPIEQARFGWYVGPKWAEAFRIDLLTDRYAVFPTVNVKQGPTAKQIEATLMDVLAELGRLDAAAAADVDAYYAKRTPADYAVALSGRAGRSPRVMLLTTRFSTVLQHSTRDAADGLRRIGCDTLLLIEPTPHHGLTRTAMRRALAAFKPDLVFQIDHHRFEHGDLFPPGLPFVNWIQDLLPHLMSPATGRKLTTADFDLTPSRQRWVDDFAYPERQCLEFRKLTRVPPRPPARQSYGRRVVYVSNWSQSAETMTDDLLAGTAGVTRDVIAEACRRMITLYATGGSLPSTGDVRRLLVGVLNDGEAKGGEAFIEQTTTRLYDRLNNVLYRQQGLAWAAAACRKLDLKLEIYGSGWDRHEGLAAYACGPIEYGPALEALTREAGVNLILEPFMCVSHQRLLDALTAGGFCLIRDHSANHTTNEWIDLLAAAGGEPQTAQALRSRLQGDDVMRFDANFAECERLDVSPGRIDHVATVSRLQAAGFYPPHGLVLPLLDRVAFGTPDVLEGLLARMTRDASLRTEISAVQRRSVESRYSYHAGMARMMDFVAGRLREVTLAPAKAA